MSHYYQNDSLLKHDIKEINYTYKNHNITLKTDAGIFSKERIDFGTNLLLNNIKVKGKRILDIGCGYGAVGVILGTSDKSLDITMSDVNERALKMAALNAEENKIEKVNVVKSDGYEMLSVYDTIISNPPIRAGKEVVDKIVLEAIDHLTQGGIICVVIQKKQGALGLQKRMIDTYGNCDIIAKDKGYFVFVSKKN